ncbi:MAG: hypothetical protein ACRDXE_03210, partial [Acidimicrobiales bacterium]
ARHAARATQPPADPTEGANYHKENVIPMTTTTPTPSTTTPAKRPARRAAAEAPAAEAPTSLIPPIRLRKAEPGPRPHARANTAVLELRSTVDQDCVAAAVGDGIAGVKLGGLWLSVTANAAGRTIEALLEWASEAPVHKGMARGVAAQLRAAFPDATVETAGVTPDACTTLNAQRSAGAIAEWTARIRHDESLDLWVTHTDGRVESMRPREAVARWPLASKPDVEEVAQAS